MPIRKEKPSVEVTPDEPISVTVDASDLTVASAEPLRNIIGRYGRPVSARAFADFQQPNLSDLAVQLYQMGFSLVHCPSWPNGDGFPKAIVSDVMAQDLRDQVEQLEGVETYLLVATSRDYIAVSNALRRHEINIVVVAEDAKVCRELKNCADEFVLLPPTRPEPIRHSRVERAIERIERPVEPVLERAVEPVRPERPAPSRSRRTSTVVRAERPVEQPRQEPVRPEPVRPEPVRPERPEPVRVERAEPVRPERSDATEPARLPSDVEVLGEVKRIVAAEGICTPRRLARALCPVDRTSTGELRSRIANRIQTLIDSGKLQRERLVVGGTSVETLSVRDERAGREAQLGAVETAPAMPSISISAPSEPEVVAGHDLTAGEAVEQVELAPRLPVEVVQAEAETMATGGSPVKDLDAFVESMLRSSEVVASTSGENRAEPAASEAPAEPTAAPVEEPPKKRASRPRRRTQPKPAAVPETNGAS